MQFLFVRVFNSVSDVNTHTCSMPHMHFWNECSKNRPWYMFLIDANYKIESKFNNWQGYFLVKILKLTTIAPKSRKWTQQISQFMMLFLGPNFAVHHDIFRAKFHSSPWYFEGQISQFTMIFWGLNFAVHHDIWRAKFRSSPWYFEGSISQFTTIFEGLNFAVHQRYLEG